LQTKIAFKLIVLTMVRTGELIAAKWSEIDFMKQLWRIPADRMKMGQEHIVPLSRQVIRLFQEVNKLNGDSEYVFPNRNRPTSHISENTLIYALYRLGYHSRATVHGFRATASTILHEQGFRADVIERQLSHGERNSVRAAYNHAQYLKERTEMMQHYSDFVEAEGWRGEALYGRASQKRSGKLELISP
jgi:integrase